MSAVATTGAPPEATVPVGLGHVATASFLASRLSPTAGFWIALAGGVALARASERHGARAGYGVSIAAMLQTVAVMGPARLSVPLTQAISAPVMGRLQARGRGLLPQALVAGAVRLVHSVVLTAFFIWIVTGGVDAYSGSYENVAGLFGLELTTGVVLVATLVSLLFWAAGASVVQAAVYRRGLAAWPAPAADPPDRPAEDDAGRRASRPRRFDPRAVALAAAVAFAALIASTAWPVLAAVAGWLLVAWLLARADHRVLPAGLALAGALAVGSLVFTLTSDLALDECLRRAARAALLVLVATWLRAAAGTSGLREVSRRALGRLRRLPAVPEASVVMDGLGPPGVLVPAGKALVQEVRPVEKAPVPVLDATLRWVAAESGRFRPEPPAGRVTLRVGAADVLLVLAGAALPLAAGLAPL